MSKQPNLTDCAAILIESVSQSGTEWGVSFTSSNPEPGDYVACKTEQDAVRLLGKLVSLQARTVAPWESAETAPKDGGTFLSLNSNQGDVMAVTWWHPALGRFNATGGQSYYQFTHWMPLPAKPSAIQAIEYTPEAA